jgi:hypothetical protein
MVNSGPRRQPSRRPTIGDDSNCKSTTTTTACQLDDRRRLQQQQPFSLSCVPGAESRTDRVDMSEGGQAGGVGTSRRGDRNPLCAATGCCTRVVALLDQVGNRPHRQRNSSGRIGEGQHHQARSRAPVLQGSAARPDRREVLRIPRSCRSAPDGLLLTARVPPHA